MQNMSSYARKSWLWLPGMILIVALSALTANGSVRISPGGALHHYAGSFYVEGDWINQGSYIPGANSKIFMIGNVAGKISSASPDTFRLLAINNSANITLDTTLTVLDSLILLTGNLTTEDSGDTLILGQFSVLFGEQAGRYVIGMLRTKQNIGMSAAGTGATPNWGIGVDIAAGAPDAGWVTVLRKSGTTGKFDIYGAPGINRSWALSSSATVVNREFLSPKTGQSRLNPLETLEGVQDGDSFNIGNPFGPDALLGRNLTFKWIVDDDNLLDLTTAQLWRSYDNGVHWVKVGTVQNVSATHSISGTGAEASLWTVNDSSVPTNLDGDNDGWIDTADNCPLNANEVQTANVDGDALGDACDICNTPDSTYTVTPQALTNTLVYYFGFASAPNQDRKDIFFPATTIWKQVPTAASGWTIMGQYDMFTMGEAYRINSASSLQSFSGCRSSGPITLARNVTLRQYWHLCNPYRCAIPYSAISQAGTSTIYALLGGAWLLASGQPSLPAGTVLQFRGTVSSVTLNSTCGARDDVAIWTDKSWQLGMTATAGNVKAQAHFGADFNAVDGPDAELEMPMTNIPKGLNLSFPHEWSKTARELYALDMRTPLQQETTWDLLLTIPTSQAVVTLTWPQIGQVTTNLSFALVDPQTGQHIDMRTADHYTITRRGLPGKETKHDYAMQVVVKPGNMAWAEVSSQQGPIWENRLDQSWPNPFSRQTSIRFELAKETPVRLKIYNIAGQLVKTLVDDVRSAGPYEVVWDGRNSNNQTISAGVYFYRIEADDFVQAKRMVLIR